MVRAIRRAVAYRLPAKFVGHGLAMRIAARLRSQFGKVEREKFLHDFIGDSCVDRCRLWRFPCPYSRARLPYSRARLPSRWRGRMAVRLAGADQPEPKDFAEDGVTRHAELARDLRGRELFLKPELTQAFDAFREPRYPMRFPRSCHAMRGRSCCDVCAADNAAGSRSTAARSNHVPPMPR